MSVTIRDWLKLHVAFLEERECIYLIKNFCGDDFHFNYCLSEVALNVLEIVFERRVQGEPLAKIVELKAFYHDYFVTNQYTLDPRPETEFLIEKIFLHPRSVLELGVGTGCLLFSILKKFIKAKGIGVDIDERALSVANENCLILQLQSRVKLLRNNWAYGLTGNFDLVVVNPPYVDRNAVLSKETSQDPPIALFGGEETYKDLIYSLERVVFKQLLLEVPKNLLDSVQELLQKRFMGLIEVFNIWSSDIFCVSVVLCSRDGGETQNYTCI